MVLVYSIFFLDFPRGLKMTGQLPFLLCIAKEITQYVTFRFIYIKFHGIPSRCYFHVVEKGIQRFWSGNCLQDGNSFVSLFSNSGWFTTFCFCSFNWLQFSSWSQASRILQKVLEPVIIQEASTPPSEMTSGDESLKSEILSPVPLLDYSNLFGEDFQLPDDQWDSSHLNILDLGAVEEGIIQVLFACASQVNYRKKAMLNSLSSIVISDVYCVCKLNLTVRHLHLTFMFLSLFSAVNWQGEVLTSGLHCLWYKHCCRVSITCLKLTYIATAWCIGMSNTILENLIWDQGSDTSRNYLSEKLSMSWRFWHPNNNSLSSHLKILNLKPWPWWVLFLFSFSPFMLLFDYT